ncbi:precorrin-6y C5,15-methyltransferase (decarboxylating) subunit CbiE [Anaerotruncus colihominis]|jgi:precorrin-6Y C5,15-methyltransferase (decarboxylating)|uniref:precorrin-6y C5,15-methyltransferase (decarboxylating) subunit CbiE n=2 Tax=Anaerotruncus TaxID=244127 RepID=UPI0026E95B5F|nr:precorrin-6y C5,15-methyltransferase (decarboxylating) subunit CbiE [Anaerotruncus colihominis]
MMDIYLIGAGMGNPELLTGQARAAIGRSRLLIGARRLLEEFAGFAVETAQANTAEQAQAALRAYTGTGPVAVLASGDVGFYSIAKKLSQMLDSAKITFFPGISSLQYFCARLEMAWDDVKIVSLHGRGGSLPAEVRCHMRTFVLTGGENSVQKLCEDLAEAGLGEVHVSVGERLSYADERIVRGTARDLAGQTFSSLCVMLVENRCATLSPVTHGLLDDVFTRGDVPMTKAEVRAVSIAKLRLRQDDTVWDIGAGTGSVALEIARVLRGGMVYAVERNEEAAELIAENRRRLGVDRLEIISGRAPEVLADLPAPDAVFIGGSSGSLGEMIQIALEKNRCVRFVVNAITLETVHTAQMCFERFELEGPEIIQVTVAKARTVGHSHMMMGQNPVYILSAGGYTDDD